MSSVLRIAIRIAAVIGIAIFCGATGCTQPIGDIMYAPGYGYVVKVQRYEGIFGGPKDRSYYYIFPTEERAAEFYHQYYLDPNGFQKTLQPGERGVNDDDYEEFNKITKLLRPLPPPPPLNEMEIPLAVPELPQPIPQTPQ